LADILAKSPRQSRLLIFAVQENCQLSEMASQEILLYMDELVTHSERIERPWRFLLCDDSVLERVALAQFLRNEGYVVDEASDGQAAIVHLKHRPVDLLILDLNMPFVDGFAVLNYIQEHRPELAVILLSGMPLDEIQQKMHELHKRELPPLLIKPIDPHQILELIDLQLSGLIPDVRKLNP
jgi:CheY-like chemotaxis protein